MSKSEVFSLRERIATLQAERRSIIANPRCRAEVELQIHELVDHLHARGTETIANELQRSAAGGIANPFQVNGTSIVVAGVAPVTLDVGSLLVALIGKDAVRKVLLAPLAKMPLGMAQKDRAARLAEITAELDKLEAEEERLIVDSEMFGEPIARRRDARPEIVLAMPAD
jgi:hypothetical protein